MVNGASPGPAPAAQARASSSRLTRSSWRTWPHRKLRRKVPRVDGAFDPTVENTGRPTGAQRIGVVDAIAASQGRGDQGHHLVAGVGPARRAAEIEVMVNEFPQAQVLGESGRQEQAGIGHQTVVVKDDANTVGVVAW